MTLGHVTMLVLVSALHDVKSIVNGTLAVFGQDDQKKV